VTEFTLLVASGVALEDEREEPEFTDEDGVDTVNS